GGAGQALRRDIEALGLEGLGVHLGDDLGLRELLVGDREALPGAGTHRAAGDRSKDQQRAEPARRDGPDPSGHVVLPCRVASLRPMRRPFGVINRSAPAKRPSASRARTASGMAPASSTSFCWFVSPATMRSPSPPAPTKVASVAVATICT